VSDRLSHRPPRPDPLADRVAAGLRGSGLASLELARRPGRTDLVFNEPPSDTMLAQAVEGMVLTEWKVAKDADGAAAAAREARVQTDFRQGALAGLELRSHRYTVTPKELPSDALGPIITPRPESSIATSTLW
jgi:hypothetical protein